MLQETQQKSMAGHKPIHIQSQIKITIVTWNLQGTLPHPQSITKLFNKIIADSPTPDLICIATQQCERSLGISFFYESKDQWESLLLDALENQYKFVMSETLQGLHTALYVIKDLQDCFTSQNSTVLRAGACNLLGNKGAVSLTCNLLGQNFQFINCHLAPHQTSNDRRNEILIKVKDVIAEPDTSVQVFICGDLNYRIDITKQQYHEMIKDRKNTESQMDYSKMLEKDQLTNQDILRQRFFNHYQEAQIKFPPTYKLSPNTPFYNKNRIPGWTDRIFMRKGKMKQTSYHCMYNLYGSDHRPVIATFQLEVQETLSIFPEEYIKVTSDKCQLI